MGEAQRLIPPRQTPPISGEMATPTTIPLAQASYFRHHHHQHPLFYQPVLPGHQIHSLDLTNLSRNLVKIPIPT